MKSDAAATPSGWQWRLPSLPPFRLAGFAWFEQDHVYRRLPVKPPWPIRPEVDALADCTAGGQVQFRTDSPRLAVRVVLAGPPDLYHMPATGQCGFDCYVGPPGAMCYLGTAKFDRTCSTYEHVFFAQAAPEMRCITLNFPLYQGVRSVEIGIAPDVQLLPPPPYEDARPIIVYGTSIDQGGCASRPGMAFTNILSRQLNRPVINLGFNSNGRGEPELARLIGLIPAPALIVLNYEANACWDGILERTLTPFIAILRESHPHAPILVLSRTPKAREMLDRSEHAGRLERLEFQRRTVRRRFEQGDARTHFLSGEVLWGEDGVECTVDGEHPTDLGFARMASCLDPIVRRILAACERSEPLPWDVTPLTVHPDRGAP